MPRGAKPPELVRSRTGVSHIHGRGRRGFNAEFDGRCATCAGPIIPGDSIFYAPDSDAPSGMNCCGERSDEELAVYQNRDDSLSVDEDDPATNIARTLPRGKTAADKCGKCWQIPSSSGVCGCDP